MIKFKSAVKCPKVVILVAAAANAHRELDLPGDMWVTSLNDSVHMRGSKHYEDEAADLRTRDLTQAQVTAWAKVIKRRLGRDYQVIDEGDHLHLEFDPQ
jgi:hypothetical protein